MSGAERRLYGWPYGFWWCLQQWLRRWIWPPRSTAQATLAGALNEAAAVALGVPGSERAQVFQQAFTIDAPAARAGQTSFAFQVTAEGVTATGIVRFVLPVPLGPWRVAMVQAFS